MKHHSMTRRGFLTSGGATAAGIALGASAVQATDEKTIRCGFVGVGHRGSTLLKAVVGIPGVQVVGICDTDASHRERASRLVESAGGSKPDQFDDWSKLLDPSSSVRSRGTRWS